MKNIIFLFATTLSCLFAYSQNVGIGTTTPGFPLNFASTLGDKISLYGNSGNHYGFGIQGGLLQMHTDAPAANIAFGYGSSGSFTERARIINTGIDGMVLYGRLHLKNGTSPIDVAQVGGIWLYKADNSALLGFMGTQNSQNIGFYGGPGGWGFTYDAINSRVGIGNNNPNAPLAFAAALGKKITLYPGATGDVGFGVSGNRLQIYSDNPNADVAIGYDAAGTFNERFAVKPTGALALNGNTGTTGQLLQSNGSGNTATWRSVGDIFQIIESGKTRVGGLPATTTALNNSTLSLNVTQPIKLVMYYNTYTERTGECLAGSCNYKWVVQTRLNGNLVSSGTGDWIGQYFIDGVVYASDYVKHGTHGTYGPAILSLSPGAHIISFEGYSVFNNPSIEFKVYYQIIPQ